MKKLIFAGLAIGAALPFQMVRNAFAINLRRQAIGLQASKPFQPFDMMFISDVHRRALRESMFRFPVDIIVIGGDFTEGGVPWKRVEANLDILSRQAPVYFVWGNNDREMDETKLRELFAKYNVKVLEDESIPLFGQRHLRLVGIDYFAYKENSVEAAFSEVQKSDTVIFVSHTPFVFKKVRDRHKIDFALAGHTHGGQIRFGKLGIYRPGRTEIADGVVQLISNGFGTTKLPMRLGADPEFHLLTVYPLEER